MPRISQLPSLTTADNSDEIAIVDTSASVTKKITRGDLLKAPLPANAVTTPSIANGAVTASKIDFATFTMLLGESVSTVNQAISGSSYAPNANAPTVTFTPRSSKTKVTVSAVDMWNSGSGITYASPVMSGGNTLAAADARSIRIQGTNQSTPTGVFIFDTPVLSSTTITLNYKANTGTGQCGIGTRIIVEQA